MSPRRWVVGTSVLLLALTLSVARASALERESVFVPVFAQEQRSGALDGGLYVIGDSISRDVPYVQTAASAGANPWVPAHRG